MRVIPPVVIAREAPDESAQPLVNERIAQRVDRHAVDHNVVHAVDRVLGVSWNAQVIRKSARSVRHLPRLGKR
jgi:hypothetical protein